MSNLVHEMFESIAALFPNKEAIIFGKKAISYDELNKKANQLACYLKSEENINEQSVVGVCFERSIESVVTLLALQKLGACYCPIDSTYPKDRIHYMLNKANIKTIIAHKKLSYLFDLTESHCIIYDSLDYSDCDKNNLNIPIDADSALYLIYTSGSTGNPKGVLMPYKSLANLILWQNEESELAAPCTLQFTPLSFDVHFQEIFSTLTMGGRLVLISQEDRLDPVKLSFILQKYVVTRIFLPFVALRMLCEFCKCKVLPLKEIVTAGEQLRITSEIKDFFKNNPQASLYNHYGPSETHVVTSFKMEKSQELWSELPPIGTVISNVCLYLLDENNCRDAVCGEIFIGGVCLAKEYVNEPELTNDSFIEHPKYGRLYKTGDLGRYNTQGELEFLGRKDDQVKINGYRVELAEVEQALEKIVPNVHFVVEIFEFSLGHKILCAYYTGVENLEIHYIQKKLQQVLPEYMHPARYKLLKSFPVTPSGKIDKKNLPIPELKQRRPSLQVEYRPAMTNTEAELLKLWEECLLIEGIGTLDKFFDLGGTSLLAVSLVHKIKQHFVDNFEVADLFQYSTIKEMADFISKPDQVNTEYTYQKKIMNEPIAIIGLNGKFPNCNNIDELWQMLLQGNSGIKKFRKDETHSIVEEDEKTNSNFVCAKGEIKNFDRFDHQFFGLTPREAQLMDPQQRKMLEGCYELLSQAGINPHNENLNIGIFAGEGNNGYEQVVKQYPEYIKQLGSFNSMLANEKDYIATRVAHKLNLKGPALSIHTGCSTSLVAIISAVNALRAGQCDMAIAGGVSISGLPNRGHLYQQGGILTQDGTCRPYEQSATGTLFTDGLGVVLLAPLSHAIEQGFHIHAVIKGVGLNNDGSDKMSFTAPSVNGQKDAILRACADADLSLDQIDYFEGHGTATPIGDPIELKALTSAFEFQKIKSHKAFMGSIKANIGHLTAAAGVAGLIKGVKILETKTVPPLINYSNPNPNLISALNYVCFNTEAQSLSKTDDRLRVGVSSFGVGGTNAHVILEEYKANEIKKQNLNETKNCAILVTSAKDEESLSRQISALEYQINKGQNIQSLAYNLALKEKFSKRAAIVVSKDENYLLNDISKKMSIKNSSQVTLMFPGQGSQYMAMGKQLLNSSSFFKNIFDELCTALLEISNIDLVDMFLDHEQKKSDKLLNDTYYTQPYLYIMEYSIARYLIELGVKPIQMIGHSIGEFVAATIAGVFSPYDALKIICKRASLMKALPKGSMLLVALGKEAVTPFLNRNIQIAAVNAFNNTVLAGTDESIQKLVDQLSSENIMAKKIHTSHAFHSQMMKPIVSEFYHFLKEFEFKRPNFAFYSCVTTQKEIDLFTQPMYWAEHVEKPVLFWPTLKNLIKETSGLLCEVGPRKTLTNFSLKAIKQVKASNTHALSLLSGDVNNELSDFYKGIAKMWCYGVDLKLWDLIPLDDQIRGMGIPYVFKPSKHWLEFKTNKINYMKKNNLELGKKMNEKKLETLLEKLSVIFEEASGVDVSDYSQDTNFVEMGMDSLFLTQVALNIQKELDVDISFRQLLEDFSSLSLLAQGIVQDVSESALGIKNEDIMASPSGEVRTHITDVIKEESSFIPNSENKQDNGVSGDVESIVQQQLNLMQRQLELLSSGNISKSLNDKIRPQQRASAVERAVPTQPKKEKSTKVEVSNVKKAFGASAKINLEKIQNLSNDSKKLLDDFVKKYNQKTLKSKEFTQTHRKIHADPRAVTGFRPQMKEIVYPIVVNKSQGQSLWDLDGNKYVDMTCGFGSNFFGNANERINQAVIEQLNQGVEIGPQHPLTADVCLLVQELTGNERVAFCNTGSEAVLGAMRVARTISGKDKIVVFEGSYHGICDEVILRGSKKGKSFAAAPGISNDAVSRMIVMNYGDEKTFDLLDQHKDEIAAVLVEPVQSRRADFQPKEFLQQLRRLTEKLDICLIFDEVITGFRIHPGGAQAYFDVRADLVTYGKIVGGGMPIGVISGKAKYMDALDGGFWQYADESTPTVGVTYFAGTFVRHPLALAAAKEALTIIKELSATGLDKLNKVSKSFVEEINAFCLNQAAPVKLVHFGSLMKPKWDEECDFSDVFFALMRFHGVHVYDGFPWFVNLAHTEDDLRFVISAFKKSILSMQMMGLIKNTKVTDTSFFDQANPPYPNAVLGRNENGEPCWYKSNNNELVKL
ncbi:MAG: amino acid adenylation domain-containing protein [Bacteriovoracaceae bacterium]|jgi:amino acid adenylation domain-containing protein|nr:amino acid adenylation domain-containing protein [Bacteriovoracaceae bacterium]